uniref:Uncharacterized protein n=1 Tax=Heterorhabditis bacteriophora TaxID=37862 RepID=A0A1I7XUC0_HETBA
MADPFAVKNEIKRDHVNDQHSSKFSSKNNWGFDGPLTEWPDEEYTSKLPKRINMRTTTPYYEEIDPKRNGLLKDIGSIGRKVIQSGKEM